MTDTIKKADPRIDYYADCENEPVHIPEMLQSAGALVVLDNITGRITRVSANTDEVVGLAPQSLLGNHATDLLGKELYEQIKAEDLTPQKELASKVFSLVINNQASGDRPLTMLAHRTDQGTILEFEADLCGQSAPYTIEYKFLEAHSDFANAGSESALVQQVIDEISRETGFEHVMYYRLNEDGAGIVTNESCKGPGVESFLNHHFPASDVPKIVRDIYKKNPLRMIFDADALPVPVLSEKSEAGVGKLDMTYAQLRAVAPVHIRYLRNMGIRSSFSIAVCDDEQLLGIIACHNRDAVYLDVAKRAASLAVSYLFVAELKHLRELQHNSDVANTREILSNFSNDTASGNEFISSFSHYFDQILALFDASSLFLQFADHQVFYPPSLSNHGAPVPPAEFRRQSIYLSDELGKRLKLTNKQQSIFTGGILINLNADDFLIIGRTELVTNFLWAGNPTAKLAADKNTGKLNPRHSFATWNEEVRGHSKPFAETERVMADILRQELIEADSLEHRRQIEIQLRQQANTDPLTKLLNRRGFTSRGSGEFERSLRYERPLGIIYFDIDHFKRVNDTYGHDAGDEVLLQISSRTSSRLRSNDIFGRLGGEEFAILLPETSKDAAVAVAENIRKLIEDTLIEVAEDTLSVTISCGVAMCNANETNNLEKLLSLADQRLYKAKESGRNRVVAD